MIVASNPKVLAQLNAARAIVNGACSFRLWSNDLVPTPATPLAHFAESTFPGYNRVNTSGKFGVPFKVVDGLYQCSSSPFVVVCSADSTESVYGWLIWLANQVLYSARFPAPIPALAGVPISVVVNLQEGSLSLDGP